MVASIGDVVDPIPVQLRCGHGGQPGATAQPEMFARLKLDIGDASPSDHS